MFKKQSWLMILSLATTQAFANAPSFTGYYAGVNLGVLNTSAKISTSANAIFNAEDDEFFAIASDQEHRLWQNSMLGSLVVGYGQFMNPCFHLGGEAYLSLSNRRAFLGNASSFAELDPGDSVYGNLTVSTEGRLHKVEFGADFLPGYLLEPCTIAYGRIGIGFNRIHLESNSTLLAVGEDDSVSYYTPLYNTENEGHVTLRLGFGVEHEIYSKITLCGDYIVNLYGSTDLARIGDTNGFNKEGDGELIVNPRGFSTNADIHLFTQSITFGFKYYFL